MRSKLALGLSVLACATAITKAAAESKVLYVDKSAPAGGDGSDWGHAFRDVQVAIDAVRAGSFGTYITILEFRIAQGDYTPDRASGDRSASFDFSFGVTSAYAMYLQGSFAGLAGPNPDVQDFVRTRTIFSGDLAGNDTADRSTRSDNSHVIMRLTKPDTYAFVNGISIRGAFTDPSEGWTGESGGLRLENGIPSIGDCYFANATLEDNQAIGDGGAAWSNWRATRFGNCVFRRNVSVAGRGGAFAHFPINLNSNYSSADATIYQENRAAQGGALFSPGRMILAGCTFADNIATERGGAIAGGDLRAVGSLFFRNRAPESAAMFLSTSLELYHCTVVAHSLSNAAVIDGTGPLTLDRMLLWDNQTVPNRPLIRFATIGSWSKATDCFFEGGTSFISVPSGALEFQNVSGTDPKFVSPWLGGATDDSWKMWNYRLRLDSPAIQRGQNRYFYDITDLDGQFMQGSGENKTADLGCYYSDSRVCFADLAGREPEVDDTDFELFARAYAQGIAPKADMRADFNRDGRVDDADFAIFSVAYDALLCP